MNWLANIFGGLFDAFIGTYETTRLTGPHRNEVHRYEPDQLGPDEQVYVESRKVIYRQRYDRWWIPDRHYAVYHVRGFYQGPLFDVLADKLHETVIYPSMGFWLFRHTNYPHVYAVHAFLDRVVSVDPRLGLRA